MLFSSLPWVLLVGHLASEHLDWHGWLQYSPHLKESAQLKHLPFVESQVRQESLHL